MKFDNNYKDQSTEDKFFLKNNLERIYKTVDYIDEKLINKDIYVCTRNREVLLRLEGRNVPHLFGFYHPYGTPKLWKDLKNHRLDLNKTKFKKDGTTTLKVQALQALKELFEGECRLLGTGFYSKVSYDSALRTNKLILFIGLKCLESGVYVANTALNIRNKPVDSGEEIIEIYTIDRHTKYKNILKKRS